MLLSKPQTNVAVTHQCPQITSPEDVVAALNQRFLEKGEQAQSFTMIYGVLDIATGKGRLCQAGHPYPMIIDIDGRSSQVGAGGFPVGMLSEATYQGVDFHLAKGERMILYSDGISECHNNDGVAYDAQRLAASLVTDNETSLDVQVNNVINQLQIWREGANLEDDVSLLVIERNNDPQEDAKVMLED